MQDDYEFDASEYEDELSDSEEEHENEDDPFWSQYGMPAPTTLRLTYEDSSGEQSERIVDVSLFAETPWGPQFIGHCHTRNATRTFRIDRIKSCVDERTGNPVADIYDHLFDLYEKTPDYSFDQVADKHTDTLRACLHLARCAGLTEAERISIIRQVCQQLAGDKRITAKHVAPLCSRFGEATSDGVDQTFRLMAGRLSKNLAPNDQKSALRLCTKIASLKGPINAASQESIDYLAKRFAGA